MIRNFLISFFLLLFSCDCLATTGYQFELIIYSHINSKAFNSEQWPPLSNLSTNLKNAQVFETVPSDDFVLKEEENRIKKYSHYKILLHVAWQESLFKLAKPSVIHLYGGRIFDDQGNVIKTIMDESEPFDNNQNWEMNGTVSINLKRYFDLGFNLLFAMPYQQARDLADDDQTLSQPFVFISLNQTRRTKSGELNYIDHPLYGILFKIVPTDKIYSNSGGTM
jgi:hypothetical protein